MGFDQYLLSTKKNKASDNNRECYYSSDSEGEVEEIENLVVLDGSSSKKNRELNKKTFHKVKKVKRQVASKNLGFKIWIGIIIVLLLIFVYPSYSSPIKSPNCDPYDPISQRR